MLHWKEGVLYLVSDETAGLATIFATFAVDIFYYFSFFIGTGCVRVV
jgi:hypothetical protein